MSHEHLSQSLRRIAASGTTAMTDRATALRVVGHRMAAARGGSCRGHKLVPGGAVPLPGVAVVEVVGRRRVVEPAEQDDAAASVGGHRMSLARGRRDRG